MTKVFKTIYLQEKDVERFLAISNAEARPQWKVFEMMLDKIENKQEVKEDGKD